LFAAILAIKQNDIKKVLAYSTLSQLGYMVLSVGVGGYTAGFMHLITHAVFKACLFMSSGSVIFAMHHEQDMRNMGGLRKKLPLTHLAMLVTTLAIAGVPAMSGFVSKDKILAYVLGYGYLQDPTHFFLVFAGFLTALLTPFYMFRMIFMTFYGHPHDKHHFDEAHEGGWNMTVPLLVLAFFSLAIFYTGSITGGLLGKADAVLGAANDWFVNLIVKPGAVVGHGAGEHAAHGIEHFAHEAHVPAMILSVLFAGIGIFFAYLVYGAHKISSDRLAKLWPSFVQKAIDNLYYFDWFYIKVVIQKIFLPTAKVAARVDDVIVDRIAVDGWGDVTMATQKVAGAFDDVVVDGVLVDGVGGGVPTALGSSLRVLQNGKIQRYLLVAVAVLIAVFVLKGIV
jgi:NADH-quinone oxidoreductase subunit L